MAAFFRQQTDDNGLLLDWHPLAFATKANSDDLPTYWEAMKSPDANGFMDAIAEENATLKSMGAWEVVDQLVGRRNVLPGTWTLWQKRYPDGRVKKLKARFCERGDKQIEGVDFFETYTPVMSWNTVCSLLALVVHLGLASCQIDYTSAFVHANVNDEVYIEMPQGFRQEGKVLRLKKSLYGLHQSPLNFFKHL